MAEFFRAYAVIENIHAADQVKLDEARLACDSIANAENPLLRFAFEHIEATETAAIVIRYYRLSSAASA